MFEKVLPSYGIQVSFIDDTRVENYQQAMQKNTKVLYVETPANPTMRITDLQAVGQLGHEAGVMCIVSHC